MKKPAVRAWIHAADHPWAMTEAALRQLLDIAARETAESWEAVAAKFGKPLEATWTVEIRDGVAIVPVNGPIFRYANLFTMFSGGTSVQDLATDFQASLENPSVKAILLNVDSPGGEVAGINEMATMIRAAAGAKPVVSYVGGMAASGAYWLASQSQAIVADATAMLGSIGVVATFRDKKAADEKAGIANYEIVSSQSPKKRMDPATESGRAYIQALIDDLAAEFVAAVAEGRGVTAEKVLSDFGQGGVMTAKRAIDAGMADRLGSFESVLAELAQMEPGKTYSFGAAGVNYPNKGALLMEQPKTPETPATAAPPDVGAIKAEAKAEGVKEGTALGVKNERARIAAILGSEEAKGRESLARAMALESDLEPEAARKMLAASPIPVAAPKNALAAAMGDLKNPKVGVEGGEQDEEKALIEGVLAFASKGGKK